MKIATTYQWGKWSFSTFVLSSVAYMRQVALSLFVSRANAIPIHTSSNANGRVCPTVDYFVPDILIKATFCQPKRNDPILPSEYDNEGLYLTYVACLNHLHKSQRAINERRFKLWLLTWVVRSNRSHRLPRVRALVRPPLPTLQASFPFVWAFFPRIRAASPLEWALFP